MIFSGKKPSLANSVIGMALLAACVLVILFSGVQQFSKALVDYKLQQFAEYTKAIAAKQGRTAQFTYGDVAIEGWGYEKKAIISNVSFEVSEPSMLGINRWAFSTAKMVLMPDPLSSDTLKAVFGEPVNIIENSQLRSVATFSTPMEYAYTDSTGVQGRVIEHVVGFPESITLKAVSDVDQADGNVGNLVVSYDPKGIMKMSLWPDSGQRETSWQLQNIKVSGDNVEATAASFSGKLEEKPQAENRIQGQYNLSAIDVALRVLEHQSKPYSLNADIAYVTDIPTAQTGAGTAEFTLNKLSLMSSDFKVKSEGKITVAADDPLPWGNASVDIANVKAFMASELVSAQSRDPLAAGLQKVTGQPLDSLTDISIPLKREKNSVFYVGNITFEELATTMLTHFAKPEIGSESPILPEPPVEPKE